MQKAGFVAPCLQILRDILGTPGLKNEDAEEKEKITLMRRTALNGG